MVLETLDRPAQPRPVSPKTNNNQYRNISTVRRERGGQCPRHQRPQGSTLCPGYYLLGKNTSQAQASKSIA